LISQNYPDQTLSDLATLSFPTTVVIGSSTYTITPKSTSSATPTHSTKQDKPTISHDVVKPTQTNVKSESQPHHQGADKRLAIIIGAVIGCVVFIMLGVIFFCLYRRRKDNGSFFLRRTTPSMRSNGSWRPWAGQQDTLGTSTYVTAGQSDMSGPKYPRASVIPRGPTPPVSAHPAFLHHESSRSESDENPFYTPQERSISNRSPQEIDGQEIQQVEFGHDEPARRSSHSMRNSRPPTPFSPLEMMSQMPGPAARPQVHTNPFTSPEDDEAEDTVSPVLPNHRNSDWRHSHMPMVHYPSWDEVSAFSFSGSGDERDARQQVDGGDGWRPDRERRDGRYELA